MSNLHRIKQLLEYLEEEPDNPFNLYALALEYQNHDPEKVAYYFDALLKNHKTYLPTYYHAAEFFANRQEISNIKGLNMSLMPGLAGQIDQQQMADLLAFIRQLE